MTQERIREIGNLLRNFAEYAQNNYINREVEIEEDEYYVDLGNFGEQSMSVTLRDESYELDPDDLLSDHFPLDSSTIMEMAEELESFEMAEELESFEPEDQKDDSFDDVLARMATDGQVTLVKVLRAVYESFQGVVLGASDMNGLSLGPLPPKPLPWPGALRPEIDYTANDFPLRYQPPPGFDWAKRGASGIRVDYRDARMVPATEVPENEMVLDLAGRAYWGRSRTQDARDPLQVGSRWVIWHLERDGIPCGSGFSAGDAPRAFDMDGNIIPGGAEFADLATESNFWGYGDVAETARRRLREIRQEFEVGQIGGAPSSAPDYDPLTVGLQESKVIIVSSELRPGDDIVGPMFGRVIAIEDGEIVMDRNGQRNRTSYNPTFSWEVQMIDVPDRGSVPTAERLQPAVF